MSSPVHQCHAFRRGTVDVRTAWTPGEVRTAVHHLLDARSLPARSDARILIKPNLNNDLVALSGNSTDLRVLCALIDDLRDRGYTHVTLGDGSNVGVERRGLDVMKRLRIRRLAARAGVRLVDLNEGSARRHLLHGGARPQVSSEVLDADFVISVPTVKTHAEAGLSAACKNWVGIVRGQDKRQMHLDLGRNIATLVETVPPDLVVVDGLVAMEGNGPGDGDPIRLGVIVAASDPWLCDLVLCRLVGVDWRRVPYLEHGYDLGHIDDDAVTTAEGIPALHAIAPPPPRSRLSRLAERRELHWLKRAVRPVVTRPAVTELAYRAGIVQDVYHPDDDTISALERDPERCGECRRCEAFCPTALPLERIGRTSDPAECIGCLYCWWVCPKDAITLTGELNAMERQVDRYKSAIEIL